MCGSGTIPVEAALIASDIPAGRFRQFYGFQRWRDYNEELYSQVRKESESKAHIPLVRISASDISENSVSMTRTNVESAGLSDIISISKNDFSDVEASDNEGIIIMNPPYGQRI